ncbi:adenine phosphoribosyltransferase [bacterium]|nr:adenine phosphoribosyltransferase [bacterium]
MQLEPYIRTIPDFPRKGIGFRDITTLLREPDAFREAVRLMADPFRGERIDKVAGIESRGFIFGGALAIELEAGFVPIRKPGKLPAEVISESYTLEYGSDSIEVHRDAVLPGERVLLADDLLATGGTMAAAVNLVSRLKGEVAAAVFLIELSFIGGRARLEGIPVHVLIDYRSE